jgi:hypothetical protein
MPRYLVFADIINSITDISKNVRGKVPLGITDGNLTAKNEAKLREKYRIEPNQMFRLEKIYNLEHFLVAEGKAPPRKGPRFPVKAHSPGRGLRRRAGQWPQRR